MKKIYLIFLMTCAYNIHAAHDGQDPLTDFNNFLNNQEEKIQSQGTTLQLFADCVDRIIQQDTQGSLPLEKSMDMLFQKTSLQPNSIINGCYHQLGGCNYTFLQLVVLGSLFQVHESYKRIITKALEYGGDPHYATTVDRGLTTEPTTVIKELAYWRDFTSRQTLKAQDEIAHADKEIQQAEDKIKKAQEQLEQAAAKRAYFEERKKNWNKDLVNSQETFNNVASIQELLDNHIKNKKKTSRIAVILVTKPHP